jgi:hypothetical protein
MLGRSTASERACVGAFRDKLQWLTIRLMGPALPNLDAACRSHQPGETRSASLNPSLPTIGAHCVCVFIKLGRICFQKLQSTSRSSHRAWFSHSSLKSGDYVLFGFIWFSIIANFVLKNTLVWNSSFGGKNSKGLVVHLKSLLSDIYWCHRYVFLL